MFSEQMDRIQARLPPMFVTISIMGVLTLIYILGMIFYPYRLLEQSSEMLGQWGQSNRRVINGEWYRLFTAFLIHGNIIHLASNLLFLLIFSTRLEELTEGHKIFLVFLSSGIFGNIATLFSFLVGMEFLSFGASGAVFGLLGAVIFLLRGKSKRERRTMYYFIIIFFTITIGQDTNVISHLFGLIGGFYVMKILHKM